MAAGRRRRRRLARLEARDRAVAARRRLARRTRARPAELPRPLSRRVRAAGGLAEALQRRDARAALPRVPAIDFSRDEAVLLAPGPRSSTGYDLRVLSVTDEGGRVVVARPRGRRRRSAIR